MHLKRQLASNFGLLLFSATLLHSPLGAQTWEGVNTDINAASNWDPNTVPTAGDTANFITGYVSPLFTNGGTPGPFSVGTVNFNAGNSTSYTLNADGAANTITINLGVTNNSGNSQFFEAVNGSNIIFVNGASTDSNGSTYLTEYSIQDTSTITFQGSSSGNGLVGVYGASSNLIINGSNTTIQLGALEATTAGPNINLGDSNTLQVGKAPFNTLIARNIIDNGSTNPSNFIKEGTNTITLSGTGNVYQGNTEINNGTLFAAAIGSLSPNSNFTITTPGKLELDSGTTNSIGTLSGTGTVQFINGANLTVHEAANTTFQGKITGAGNNVLTIDQFATLTLDSSNLNDYAGLTRISGAGTVLQAGQTNAFSPNSNVNIILGGKLDLNNQDNAIGRLFGSTSALVTLGTGTLSINEFGPSSYLGTITGSGGINLNGGSVLTLNNNGGNTYSGQTNISSGTLRAGQPNSFSPNSQVNINSGQTLDLNNFNNTIGPLTGSGNVSLGTGTITVNETNGTLFSGTVTGSTGGLTLIGGNFLTFNNSGSNYSGLTLISDGTFEAQTTNAFSPNSPVQVDTNGTLRVNGGNNSIKELSGSGSVQINGPNTLNILQTNNTTFSGAFSSNGNLALDAASTATLHVTGVSPNFTNGSIVINGGTFNLNGSIGSSGQSLDSFINSGATLTGVGTLYGNLTINSGATISPGNSIGTFNVGNNYTQNPGSTYLVELNSTTSDLINVGGSAQLNGGDVIATPLSELFINHRYTILHSTGPLIGTFSSLTLNGSITNPYLNSQLVYDANNAYIVIQTSLSNAARTFNEIQVANQLDSITNASAFLSDALGKMILLSETELNQVFNELSGEQYTLSSISSQIISHQFIRRLYDPVRSIVTRLPCSECCEEYNGLSVWIEGGAGAAELKNGDYVKGFKMRGYEVTAGAQKTFDNYVTLGIAGSYAYDQIDFNLNGNQKVNSYLGGLYALYRPDSYYLMADIAYGKSQTKLNRTIDISDLHLDAKSTPSFSNATAYGELGVDMTLCSILIQPFVAIEVDQFFHGRTHENGAKDFDLTISKWDRTLVYTNLGLHITQNICSFSWGFDVAYLYRFTPVSTQTRNHFATFGADFPIRGVEFGKNGFEGTFNIAKTINNDFRIYAEVSGQVWDRLAWVTALAGIQYSW